MSGRGAGAISDFHATGSNADRLQLSGYLFGSFDQLKKYMVQSGSNTVIRLNGIDSITLNNVRMDQLSASNFSFGNVAAAPVGANIFMGSGADTLVLKLQQDAYKGNAQFVILVDGKQVGGTLTASALRFSDQQDSVTLHGNWGTGDHVVTVKFVNDLWNAKTTEDRNLYVQSAVYNGQEIAKASASMFTNGTHNIGFTASAPAGKASEAGSGSDTLVLQLSQDAYRGNAKYQVFVDGKQVGGTFEAQAGHGSGARDTLTLHGDWGNGSHDVKVAFLNDLWNATTREDRNLYVESATYNGIAVDNAKAGLFTSSGAQFAFMDVPSAADIEAARVAAEAQAAAEAKAAADAQAAAQAQAEAESRAEAEARAAAEAKATAEAKAAADAKAAAEAIAPQHLVGTGHDDALAGRNGSDTLQGGHGDDLLTGGGASDLFIHASGDGADIVTDFTATGAEADVIQLGHYAVGSFAQLSSHISQQGADTLIQLGDGDSIMLRNVGAATLTADNFRFVDVAAPAPESVPPSASTPESASASKAAPAPASEPAVVAPAAPALSIGININGAEYIGPAGGKTGIDYFPTHAEMQYFAAKGMDNIRLPIAWESLQPTLNGALDPAYLAKIQDVVAYAKTLGMAVIVDLHNAGAYDGQLIGSDSVPTSAFADVWSRLATSLAHDDNVAFGLMNEPQQATAAQWLDIANEGIAAIRATGATQQILVPGVHWSGGSTWTTSDNASVLGAPGAIIDPLHNFAFEIHQYLDDTSGTHDWVVSPTIGVERLTDVTAWAREAGVPLYLGEFGVTASDTALSALANMMDFLKANADVWQGVSYFSAGTVWQDNYMFSAQPRLSVLDAAQMDVLEQYIAVKTSSTPLGDGTTRIDTFGYGDTHASMSDIVDASGRLVSRAIYDPDGQVLRQFAEKGDGTALLSIHDETSGAIASSKLYDAANRLIEESSYAADHSFTVKVYTPGTQDVVREEKHDAGGALVDVTDHSGDNLIVHTHYDAGSVAMVEEYTDSWTFLDRVTYSATGVEQQHVFALDNGHYAIESYDPHGILTSHGDYTASWSLSSWINYVADGTKNVTTMLNDGGKTVAYYAASATSATLLQHYTADGHLDWSGTPESFLM
ncbi:cellulase family glycosylhydrolase [Sphingobium aquiterrae]|uniref:cellulase family glycosylhydrolase n=1 Tax=Sphingobium aquiterrae TaxID=2038656 RepID=UPI0030172829